MAIPDTVATYLQDYAPRGDFIGYWLDKGWAWSVHALLFFAGCLLSTAAALMQRGR